MTGTASGSLLVLLVAALAMLLVGIRPRPFRSWIWPAGGALLVIALGAEPISAAFAAIAQQWNVLLFILGLMGLSAAAAESGAFAWLTEVLLERSGGSRRRLFVVFFLAGALITLVFSNDATAIVLTPFVYRTVVKCGGDVMPFLFGCIFVAGTASFGLPFSNPANVLILPHPPLLVYLWQLGPPELAAIAVNLLIFLFVFRRQLAGTYDVPDATPPDSRGIRTLVAMLCVGVAYLAALALSWPLGPVAVLGAVFALGVARIRPIVVVRRVTWRTFALLAGLFVLLDAVARAGYVRWAHDELAVAMHHGAFAAAAVATLGAAILSNVFNNLPVAVAASYLIAHPSWTQLAYPLIAGVDLGPNLTTSGSLATILWFSILRDRGVRVDVRQYLRLGALVVAGTLAVTILWFRIAN